MNQEEPVFRAGRIRYTNDLPVYAAYDTGALAFPGHLYSDVPTALNARLLQGDLDISPISAFAYLQNAGRLKLWPDMCIGSRSDVWSVLCISARPLSALHQCDIALTRDSASGKHLLQVLLERCYGVTARYRVVPDPFLAAENGEPALLIGDRAIDARFHFPPEYIHDLGSLWHAWTGLDMVYAVWASPEPATATPERVASALESLRQAQRWGEENRSLVVGLAQAAFSRPPGFYERYYQTLNFSFDVRARAGLQRFADELHLLGLLETVPSLRGEDDLVTRKAS